MIRSFLSRLLKRDITVLANVTTTPPDQSLSQKKIIVTGGNKGLGFAIAKKAVEKGALVLITGRNLSDLQRCSAEIGCQYRQLDMLDTSSFDSFIMEADRLLGGLDALVNNAGISLHEEDYDKVTPDSFDRQINTNLKGSFFLAQSFIRHLTGKRQEGNILFISSETGETVDIRPYGWTKAAVNSMVQGLAYRLAREGIRVNALAPGVCSTEMTGISTSNLRYEGSPIGRAYLPLEMAEVAAFLLSDVSNCISGQIITCNNGKTINARWK